MVSTNPFCLWLNSECTIQKHHPKGRKGPQKLQPKPGYYLLNPQSQQAAFVSPFIELVKADGSPVFASHQDEHLTREAWLSVFALINRPKVEDVDSEDGDVFEVAALDHDLIHAISSKSAPTPMKQLHFTQQRTPPITYNHPEVQDLSEWARHQWTKLMETVRGMVIDLNLLSAVIGKTPKHFSTVWESIQGVTEQVEKLATE